MSKGKEGKTLVEVFAAESTGARLDRLLHMHPGKTLTDASMAIRFAVVAAGEMTCSAAFGATDVAAMSALYTVRAMVGVQTVWLPAHVTVTIPLPGDPMAVGQDVLERHIDAVTRALCDVTGAATVSCLYADMGGRLTPYDVDFDARYGASPWLVCKEAARFIVRVVKGVEPPWGMVVA